jgi:hypothetical protein
VASNRTVLCPTDGLRDGQPVILTVFGINFGRSGAQASPKAQQE